MKYEELPDYSSGDVSRDLNTVEELLLSNGLKPMSKIPPFINKDCCGLK
jgi:hypothetical protein